MEREQLQRDFVAGEEVDRWLHGPVGQAFTEEHEKRRLACFEKFAAVDRTNTVEIDKIKAKIDALEELWDILLELVAKAEQAYALLSEDGQ